MARKKKETIVEEPVVKTEPVLEEKPKTAETSMSFSYESHL